MTNEEISEEFKVLRDRNDKFTNKLQEFSEGVSLLNNNLEHFTDSVKELKIEVSNFKEDTQKDIKLNTEFRLLNQQLLESFKSGKEILINKLIDYAWKLILIIGGLATIIFKFYKNG